MTSDAGSEGDSPHVSAQVAASWAAFEIASRHAARQSALDSSDAAFASAMREMQAVRDFVTVPEHILGSSQTKHGEIAEQVHVGVTRAFDVLSGRTPSTTFEGVGRLDAVDYRVDGVNVQSKYINGLRNALDHVLKHAEKYPDFASSDGIYHIPRDQFEQLQRLREVGQIDGLSDRTAGAVRRKLSTLHDTTGRPPGELLRPGDATYAEVQQGRIHETLENRERRLERQDGAARENIRTEHGATLGGVATAAAFGAAAGGGVCLGQAIWVKWREGKNPFKGQFSTQDWKDVGLPIGDGALGGGVAGGTLYLITNSTDLAAPFAGALVSGLMGIGSLLRDYCAGRIDAEQFIGMSQIVAIDAAVVGLATAVGQALVPVPVLGALIGSLAGKIVSSTLKDALGDSETELVNRLGEYEDWAFGGLDAEMRAVLVRLDPVLTDLESLGRIAFDEGVNTSLRLQASVSLAERVGVPEDRILRSTVSLDSFMMEET